MSGERQDRILISEIFGPTIQGEGALIGRPTIFVRTAGCDYRCRWCDSSFAVDKAWRDQWQLMTREEIWEEIEKLSGGSPLLVSLSGGNPAMQPLGGLIRHGKKRGYEFALETQGSIARKWFCHLDMLVLSPKPPSSGMETDWSALDECISAAGKDTRIILKIPVLDDNDYAYAKKAALAHPQLETYLQPVNEAGQISDEALKAKMRWLIGMVMADKWFEARVLPQLHVMIWGDKRGV